MLKKELADELWAKLRDSLMDTHEAVMTIVATQAWKPLGYKTFHEAWAEKMADVGLFSACIPHVVYQLVNEGLSDAQIAATVKGIAPETAAAMRRQQANGVPADLATLRVSRPKPKDGRKDTLFLKVGVEKLAEWERIAEMQESTATSIALVVLEAHFTKLAKKIK